MYVNQLALRGWRWNGISGFLEAFDVKFDRFLNQYNEIFASLSNCYASRQIGYICPESVLAIFDYYKIFHSRYFSLACFRILLSVPGGTSMPGFPDTVTVPDFVGCLNCR